MSPNSPKEEDLKIKNPSSKSHSEKARMKSPKEELMKVTEKAIG